MAPSKRQRTSGPSATSSQQSTLSFNRTKPASSANKIAKPFSAPSSKVQEPIKNEEKPETKEIELPAEEVAEPVEEQEEEEEAVIDEDEVQARKVTQKQINGYWAEKEQSRKTPRVHQKELSLREKVLREFDMNSQYGPCVGIQRLDRWRRARDMGRDPPIEVLAVMLKASDEDEAAKKRAANKAKRDSGHAEDWQTSIVDELNLSSKGQGEVTAEA